MQFIRQVLETSKILKEIMHYELEELVLCTMGTIGNIIGNQILMIMV